MKESLVKDGLENLIEAHATLYQFQRTIDSINAKENLKKRDGDCLPIDEAGGLTLYAVNDTTVLNNIHIHDNRDDGIEFFGGDVDATICC